jgi:membrane protein implicated in regulation of membrane protease activity
MVRQEWSLIGTIAAAITGAVVFAPVFAQYALALLTGSSVSTFNYAIGVLVSAAISIAITAFFYRINIDSAKELVRKAEV